MFTGIITEIGELKNITKISSNLYKITVHCKEVLRDIIKGESIAVNGVCLSVVDYDNNSFTADIMQETMKKTTFRNLAVSQVNLEKSLKVNDRLDGHFVTGHIDAVVKMKSLTKKEGNYVIGLQTDKTVINNIVYKGSVALNGVSLTVSDVKNDIFYVSLIPVTLEHTNFKYYNINDELNLETDILGKYVLKNLSKSKNDRGITEDFLLNNL